MDMNTYTSNEITYDKKFLIIPDWFLETYIIYIIDWFDYYNIANIKNVVVYNHLEPEYYVEDKPFFGYAVIEINEWIKNNSSEKFYNNLISETATINYTTSDGTTYFWDVRFYDKTTTEESVIDLPIKKETVNNDKDKDNDKEFYSEEEYWKSEIDEAKERMQMDLDKQEEEEYKETYHEDDEDDSKDEDYEFEETDEEEDLNYEYLVNKNHKIKTKSKSKKKENKSKKTDSTTENTTLNELIVKKNKNYLKRDKRKPFKNVWSRRLRQKQNI
tara:strand:+ start:816 stop:1634 length:819 start_codon:yes stop_codon:yes gene_type:complete